MPLPSDSTAPQSSPRGRPAHVFDMWNKRAHYYLGLYFLFFIWLFSITGLLLNHSWKFAEFWPNRRVTSAERPVRPPAATGDLQQAKELMRQLGITGEVEWSSPRTGPERLDFRVSRPGRTTEIKADLIRGIARIEETRLNSWGLIRALHTFTGVRGNDQRNRRDWFLTTIWALSMDALAAGLVLMVLSGLVLWLRLRSKRTFGLLALLLGCVVCGFLAIGLRWI